MCQDQLWPLLRESNVTFATLAARFASLPVPHSSSHKEAGLVRFNVALLSTHRGLGLVTASICCVYTTEADELS